MLVFGGVLMNIVIWCYSQLILTFELLTSWDIQVGSMGWGYVPAAISPGENVATFHLSCR